MSPTRYLGTALARATAIALLIVVQVAFLLPAASGGPSPAAAATSLTRVSTLADGSQATGGSTQPSVSSDGHFVVFASSASNLPGANGQNQIYWKDTVSGAVALVSTNTGGSVGGNGDSERPVIAAGGGAVAWDSAASDLVSNDTNGARDIFWRQLNPSTGPVGTTDLVSQAGGQLGNGDSSMASLTASGQMLSFQSSASNLGSAGGASVYVATPSGVTGAVGGIPLFDTIPGSTIRRENVEQECVLEAGQHGLTDAHIGQHALTDDGQWVVFIGGWCPGDALASLYCSSSYSSGGVIAYNLVSGLSFLVDDCEMGQIQDPGDIGTAGSGTLSPPAVSPNGDYVVVPDNMGGLAVTTPYGGPVAQDPLNANGQFDPVQVTDGGVVIFDSSASNLVSGDTNNHNDVFVAGGSVAKISTPSAGGQADNDSGPAAIGALGSWAAFGSAADNLISGDTNGASDVFKAGVPAVGGIGSALQPGNWIIQNDETYGCNKSEPNVGSCHGQAADPVDTSTGNFHLDAVDLNVTGRGPGLTVTRGYNSLDAATNGPFGFGWSSNLFDHLSVNGTTGQVTIVQEGGARVRFMPAQSAYIGGAGTFAAAPWVRASLIRNSDGSYTFQRAGGETLSFNSTGQLTAVYDANHYGQQLQYSGTQLSTVSELNTDGSTTGRTLNFTWTGSNITQAQVKVNGSAVQSVTYAYDGSGNLHKFTDVGGNSWVFNYTSHQLTQVVHPKQVAAGQPSQDVVNVYDSSHRVTSQTDNRVSPARVTTFNYNQAPVGSAVRATLVTDPKGNERVDYYDANGLRVEEVDGFGQSEAMTFTYTYDPLTLGLATTTNVATGVTTSTNSYDAVGHLVRSTDALGRSTTWSGFNQFDEATSVTDAAGTTTTSIYDANGNLASTCSPLGTPSPAHPITCASPEVTPRTTTYFHSDAAHPGDLTSVKDPVHQDANPSDAVVYTYDTYGYPASITDPLGDKTTYLHNTVGALLSSVSPNGNKAGNNPANYTTSYVDDAYGSATQITDPLGHQSTRQFDPDHALQWVKDADNNTTTYTYDGADELIQTQRPDLTTVKESYFPDGTLQTQTDGNNQVTTYAYDHLARLLNVTDPDHRTTYYLYDPAGNLGLKQDPGGDCLFGTPYGCTGYTYDAARELTGVTYVDYPSSGVTTPNVTNVGYDPDGRRTTLTTTVGSQSWTWDDLGRMTSSTEGGQTVGYGWDLAGDLTTIAYPGGSCVTPVSKCVVRHYDGANRLQTITDWNNNTTSFGYDNNSNLTSTTFPTATADVDSYSFDQADRLTNTTFAHSGTSYLALASPADNANNVSGVTETGGFGVSQTYGYDVNERVKSVTVGTTQTTYNYDNGDNLSKLQDGTQQAFDPADQLCYSAPASAPTGTCTSPPTGSTTYTYDGRGNRASVTPPASTGVGTSTYTYNEESQLAKAVVPTQGGASGEYTSLTPTSIYSASTSPGTVTVPVAGQGGVPSSGVSAVAISILASNAAGSGTATVYRSNGSLPATPDVTYDTPHSLTNMVVTTIGSDGKIKLNVSGAAATIGITVLGYYSAASGPGGGVLTPMDSTTIADTRNHTGSCTPSCSTLAANASMTVQVTGQGGVPSSGVAEVALVVTSANSSGSGFIAAGAASTGQAVAELHMNAETNTNLVFVPVSSAGQIVVTSAWASSDVVLAVAGWVSTSPNNGQIYNTVDQARVLNTVNGTGTCSPSCARMTSGSTMTVQVAGKGGVPATGATAVMVNITAVGGSGVGYLKAYANGDAVPTGYTLDYNAGVTTSSTALVKLGPDGKIVLNNQSAATDVQIDVEGWYQASSSTYTYAYDADGLRLSKTGPAGTTSFAWDQTEANPELLSETTGTSTTYTIYGPDGRPFEQILSNGTPQYLHHDRLGSTRAITNSAGTLVTLADYDPYGRITLVYGSAGTNFAYAGQYIDGETGFYYLRARYYDPNTGQFLTRDPAVTATMSPYGYAGDNPLNGVDASGRCLGPDSWCGFEHHALDFGVGLLNSATLGQAHTLLGAYGLDKDVDWCDGWMTAGNVTGQVLLMFDGEGEVDLAEDLAPAVEGATAEPAAAGSDIVPYYPPNDGFFGPTSSRILEPGTTFDRYGSDFGHFGSPEGTPLYMRSLPYDTDTSIYNVFRVEQPLTVEQGLVGPAFGEFGGGVQYLLPSSVRELLAQGVISRL